MISCRRWLLALLAATPFVIAAEWSGELGAQPSASTTGPAQQTTRNVEYDELLAAQERFRIKQTFYLRCLRTRAEEIAGTDRPRFYAILREGLYEHGEGDATQGNDLDELEPTLSPVLDRLRRVTPSPMDADPIAQQQLEQHMRDAGASQPGDCGQITKVVAGRPTKAFPDTVAFVLGRTSVRCSGVVLSKEKRAVLTAAHCVCGKGIPLFDASDKDAAVRAAAGKYSVAAADAHCKTGLCVATGHDAVAAEREERTIYHPIAAGVLFYRDSCALTSGAVVRGKDLALVFLSSVDARTERFGWDSIEINRWVVDQETYRNTASRANAILHVVGFGRTGTCPNFPREENTLKRWAHIPVRSASCLNPQRAIAYGCRAEREAVLISEQRPGVDGRCMPDTCGGDSGGPVYWRDEKTGYYFLAAITSRGLPGSENYCGPGGIYSLVTPIVQKWAEAWGVKVNVRPTKY